MPLYEITGPDGKTYEIEGPAGATKEQVVDAIMYKLNASRPSAPEKPVSIGEALKGGAKRLGSSILTGVTGIGGVQEAGEAGLARQQGITERSGSDFEKTKALWNEGKYLSSVGEGLSQIPTAIAEQAPNLAATAAAARTGAMAGTMVGGPVGGVIGGIGGAFLPSYLAQSGSNIERQVAEGQPANAAAAYGAAIPQAGLDFITDKAIFGKLLGIPTARLGSEAAEKLAKESLLKTIGKGTAKGVILETPTEVTQQMLERLQAGLPLTDDDAIAEYQQTAYQTALSGPMGVLGRVSDVSGAKGQVAEANAERQATLSRINAERAQQDANIEAIKQGNLTSQYAGEERAADLAGKAGVDAQISKEAADYQAQQAKVKERQGLIKEAVTYDVPGMFAKTESAEGVKDLLANFDEYFYFAKKEDGAALRKMLQQQLNDTKKAETKASKLSDADIEYTALADVQDSFQKQFGVTSEPELANVPLEKLKTALIDLQTEQPGQTNKYVQKKFDLAEQKLIDAIDSHPDTLGLLSAKQAEEADIAELQRRSQMIKAREKELALFDNDPLKQAAFKQGRAGWEAYQAQEQSKPQLPDEAFVNPAPPMSYDEKAAELEQMYGVDTQAQRDEEQALAELGLTKEEILNAPATRREPDVMRGTPDQTGVSETQLERADQRNVVPSETGAPAPTETQAAVTRPLGDAGRTTRGPKGRAETSEEIQPSPLNKRSAVNDAINTLMADKKITPQEYKGYIKMLRESGPDRTDEIASVSLADVGYTSPLKSKPETSVGPKSRSLLDILNTGKDLQTYQETKYGKVKPDVNESAEDVYEDWDAQESRKSKPKKDAKPKDISGKLREESTEPTTPELFAEKVSQWFNPVWYKNAVKNGMVNVVSGDINDSDLSDAIKEKYSTAKALFTPDGKAYFFIKNITKGNELGVFLHEIGEHKGLDNLIGKDRVKQLANRVRQMAEGKGSAKEVAMAKQAIEMAEGQTQNDKEIIAYFGEIAVFNGVRPGAKSKPEFGKALGWITDLWSSVKNAIKNLNLDPTKVTDKDIVDMLYGAARLEMGAAQTFEEQVGDPVPDAPEILASKARNPQWELTAEERAERAAKGLPESQVPQKYTMKERMMDTMGVKDASASTWDKIGNAIVGPMFAIHRKATNYYGPESLYNRTTGKLLGSLFLQHSLNGNNLAFRALGKGTIEIDEKGYVKAVARNENLYTVNDNYNAILDALVADGASPAVAVQQASNMILADRYKVLKAMGEKSQEEFTPAQMEEGDRLKARHQAVFDKWRKEYNAVRNNKIDLMVSSGLYTRPIAEKLMKRIEYVPLYRVTGSEAADGVFMQGLLSAKKRQELDYDTKDYVVADVMTNIAKNEMWLYKQAVFNHATNLLVDQVEDMGNGRHVKVKNPNDKQTIAYMRNGELSYFRFDDVNDMASLYAIPVINNAATRILAAAGGVLRRGITLTPSFVYRQGWQDPMRAYMQSGTNVPFMKLVGESIRQQTKNFKGETKEATELRNRGVVGAVEFQDSFDNAIDEMFGRDKTDPSIWNKAYKALETMEKLAQNSDLAARAIVYKAALAEGATEGEAALRAQMMLNYQHRGTAPLLRTLLSTIPFINTQIQSDWRLVQALQGKIPGISKAQAKKLLAMKMLKMGLFTAAYAMTRTGDDDYENESDEQRDRNFIFNVGGVPLRIPVAPEYMLLKSGVEQVTRKVMDAEFYEDRKLGHAVFSSVANLILGPSDLTPAVFMPLIENATNHSFFTDRALVGQSLLGRKENLQYTEQTSELSKFISDQLQKTGFPAVQISPIKIDNLLTGVFGTVARDAMFLSNELSDAISGKERADLRLSQIPELGTAFYNPNGSQRVADFYREYDKVMTAYNSYQSLRKTDPDTAREFLEENRKLIMLRGPAEATKKRLDANRLQRARIVANKNLSGDEKKARINEIVKRSNELVTEPTKMLRRRMED